MSFEFEDTERRLQVLRVALSDLMTQSEAEVACEYIDHGEYQLALEHLGDVASCAKEPIPEEALENFLVLGSRMEDAAVDWGTLKELGSGL